MAEELRRLPSDATFLVQIPMGTSVELSFPDISTVSNKGIKCPRNYFKKEMKVNQLTHLLQVKPSSHVWRDNLQSKILITQKK